MNSQLKYCLLVIGILATFQCGGQVSTSQSKTLKLMGCQFTIKAVADTEANAWLAINKGIKEIKRIENLISSWDQKSQTSEVNRNAGIAPVKVDQELFDLIARSIKISELTNGAFDISFSSMDRIYKFDRTDQVLPSSATIAKAKSKINYRNIELSPSSSTVYLKEKGMKIGFGGIGKGYAANKAKAMMESIDGVSGGIVNASGDLSIWGDTQNPENTWNIKVLDPKDVSKILLEIPTNNTAVVTSGDYEKYFMSEGKRFGHIIDPKSGIPTTGIKSVTIVCKDAELADALATSVFILGQEDGLYLVNQLHGVEALLITDEDELLTSENIKLNYN